MSYQGCLVNGTKERQAWRHVVMPSAPALHYQLAVMCKHTHTPDTRIQVTKGVKYLALHLEVNEQPFLFLCSLEVSDRKC